MITTISSESEKWGCKTEIAIKEFFNPPITQHHKGILVIVRELEKVLGKEKAHKLVGYILSSTHTKMLTRISESEKSARL